VLGWCLQADGAAPHQLGEEVGLLSEQALVVGEVVAEERERLDARAASEDHLGPTAGDRVQGRVALENAHRIVGAEHDPLSDRPASFRELARADPGISDSMLSTRLAALTDAGLLVRAVDEGPPVSVAYRLTEAGRPA
jgi:HxlR-like helix-turn-helix